MKKIITLLLLSKFVFAQTASLDTNSMLIGEQVNFSISNPISETEVWPTYEKFLVEGIEIIKQGKIDTNENIILQNFIITSWDSGSYYIPPISFSANNKTEGLLLNVQTVILKEGTELKDIKQPMEAPIGWSDIWPWLVGILLFALIFFLLKKYVFTKKEAIKIEKPKVIIPADITALQQLTKLDKAQVWQSGKVKLYYVNISEIIRRYIGERYNFIALELPTDEILQNLKNKTLKKADLIILTTILQRADLAKYAKSKPTDQENEESLRFGQDFINNTKITQVLNHSNINYISEINKNKSKKDKGGIFTKGFVAGIIGFLFIVILLSSLLAGKIKDTQSLDKWIKKNKTFCDDGNVVYGTLTFNKDNTFSLTNEGNPNKAQGYNFDATHAGSFSVKSGQYWKNKEPYYYIKLNYNDTRWSKSGIGYLVYYSGKLVAPEEKSDHNGFDKFSIKWNSFRAEYKKCN